MRKIFIKIHAHKKFLPKCSFNNIMARYSRCFILRWGNKGYNFAASKQKSNGERKRRWKRERDWGKKDGDGNKADEKAGYRNRCLHSCCLASPPSSQPLQWLTAEIQLGSLFAKDCFFLRLISDKSVNEAHVKLWWEGTPFAREFNNEGL